MKNRILIIFSVTLFFQISGCTTIRDSSADNKAYGVNSLKWHPGHYALFWGSPSDEQLEEYVFSSPYIKGAQIVYSWDLLEPEKDVYDFSVIENDLIRLQAGGKYLWAQIQRQGMGNPPDYLQEYVDKRTKVYAILEMPVMESYTKLFHELGKRFDQEPGFTAINSTETLGERLRPDGEEEYVRAWTYFHERCRQYFPNTVVINYVTWGPGKEKVRRDLVNYGVGVGSPDTVPPEEIAPFDPGPPPSGKNPDHNISPIYTEWDYLRGKVPVTLAVQAPSLMIWHRLFGTFTLDQIYEKGVNRLGANYMSWATVRFSNSDNIRHDFVEILLRI